MIQFNSSIFFNWNTSFKLIQIPKSTKLNYRSDFSMKITKNDFSHPRSKDIYKRALRFARDIYNLVKRFPDYEENGLRNQLRRASSSIVANFAEGHYNIYFGKEKDRLNSAMASTAECQSFLDLAYMVKYITREEYNKLDNDAQIILDMLREKILQISATMDEEKGA
jgi:four helix bundle protein